MTLWILFCRMTKDVDTLFTFYAKDRHHAELKAEEILDLHGYERIGLKAYPGGFRIVFTYIPGVIEGDTISAERARSYASLYEESSSMRSKQFAQQLRQFKEVREAKDRLESEIRLIRDQYEGDEPPV